MTAIVAQNLTKRYGNETAVSDLDITVRTGEIFGLVGPNGAGKSTTIAMFLDYCRPTSGSVSILSRDPRVDPVGIRHSVGVLPERCGLFPRLTGVEHLEYAIEASNAPDEPADLLARVGLRDAGDRPTREYSTGMAQRLRLALSLVNDPKLLLFDEPAAGLDPNGIARLRDLIITERERGTSVFVSSHHLSNVEQVCDRVAILLDGSLRTIETLDHQRARWVRLRDIDSSDSLLAKLEADPAIARVVQVPDPEILEIKLAAGADANQLLANLSVDHSPVTRPGLTELFDRLTGGQR